MALHFDFSPQQEMLAESVRGLLSRATDDAEAGARLAGHGVFGVLAPQEAGGLGLGLAEALAVAVETGRARPRFPAIETIVAADLIARVRPQAADEVLRGTALATCAAAGEAELTRGSDGRHRLRGRVTAPFAGDARWLCLPVRKSDGNAPGPFAALVELPAPGISAAPAAEFDLAYPLFRVAVDTPVDPAEVVEHGLAPMLTVLACGELTGAAEHCLDATLRHLRERVQFGRPIGVNQSLRHVAADDWVRVEGMRAVSQYAAACFDAAGREPTAEVRHAVHVAKAYCSAAARAVAEHAVQLHGGIGFTWEFGLHLALRRILRLASALGGVAEHEDALAAGLLNGDRRAR